MTKDEEEIRTLVATWMSATKAGDTETVLGLMSDDIVFLVAGQPPFGKRDFEKAARAQASSEMQIEGTSEILEVQVSGDQAFVQSKLHVSVRQPGKPPMERAGHTLSIFVRRGGRWLLARDANLLAPVNRPAAG